MTDAQTPAQLSNVRLDDLITAVRRATDDPLDQLSTAMTVSEHLGDVGDSLIGHFVDQARRAGQPWSAIGASMGVTKQAVQKRFTAKADGDPFARFTPRARNVLVHAHDDAVRSQAESITPILLARHLVPDDQSLAVVALKQTGADIDGLRKVLGDPSPTEATLSADARTMIPYSDGSKKVLENTLAIALDRGHNYVGTEHLLLALFDDEETATVLASHYADRDKIDAAITELLKSATP
ncbi:MAG TPA: Clp protease N-terminal domain-containing protein [Gordonia sp. (in: high G+C Gram-positive bacteria)]|uniref:Clp protease N-terminal domain-containing protein n=1 Tax=unclassified Gordonia (in: high G+C Gram-positive bacteria) TaxID=2657482 RepID=UPI000F929214|nr:MULTISPECIES: Clp protease N-terminal domain-containing protein [unclassified Gordonia (in: high G+C Gram-positive bacteria)]RUP39177.1 MAG: ATP-dependent Clp protease ATP-binding subunit [Gordonia sp. (in: high G+C Gram-positive bacteria)]HNP56497.1 Clp protease N-terminal domain-containing protein [Gordonia sp. (in: high G+C Gram-positive bacteria)]HRC50650.1 Clp protease N-terminal domain-containing protein [Gordonia sp. (in: high G+C Gram-positive bacteria)]